MLLGASLALFGGCNKDDDNIAAVPGITLTQFATSSVQLTGVTVSQQGQVFACYPRIEVDTIPYSVAIVNGSQSTPFPNQDWNTWSCRPRTISSVCRVSTSMTRIICGYWTPARPISKAL